MNLNQADDSFNSNKKSVPSQGSYSYPTPCSFDLGIEWTTTGYPESHKHDWSINSFEDSPLSTSSSVGVYSSIKGQDPFEAAFKDTWEWSPSTKNDSLFGDNNLSSPWEDPQTISPVSFGASSINCGFPAKESFKATEQIPSSASNTYMPDREPTNGTKRFNTSDGLPTPPLESASPSSSTKSNTTYRVTTSTRKRQRAQNETEKKYRNRLNGQFDTLLENIPRSLVDGERDGTGGKGGKRKVGKSEVLVLAKRHIRALEEQGKMLEAERTELEGYVRRLGRQWVVGLGGGVMP